MADLISRENAISAMLRLECEDIDAYGAKIPEGFDADPAVKALKALPSAQSEQKTGRWIIRDNPETGWYRVTCSECGEDVTSVIPVIGYPPTKAAWNYCPNCGSKMEEGDD